MDRENIKELLEFTYERSLNDNKDDFIKIFGIISKLCSVLKYKKLLNDEEIEIILDISNVLESKGE